MVEIADDGIGMSKHKKKQLFKLFERVRNIDDESLAENHSTSGQGLGLFLSMQLANYLEGDIRVESQEGEGTSVRVFISVEYARDLSRVDEQSFSVGSFGDVQFEGLSQGSRKFGQRKI